MKKFIAFIPALLLLVPFAARAVYVETGAGANGSAGSAETNGAVHVDVEIGGGSGNADATVTQSVDADTGLPVITITTTGEETDASFEAHAKAVKEDNARVKAADVNADGAVEVTYAHRGKLFGFIPVTLTSKTTVASDTESGAKVVVQMPWWSFLVSGASKAKADIEAALNASTAIQVNAEAEASSASRARLADAIVASLDAFVELEAGVDASAAGGTYLEKQSPENAGAAE